MPFSVEEIEPAQVTIDKKFFETLCLASGQSIDLDARGLSSGFRCLILVLSGSIIIDATRILPGGWVLTASPEGSAGDKGCSLAVLSWHGDDVLAQSEICAQPRTQWYSKYQASVAPLETNKLAPWSGYWIEVPPGDGTAHVHTHHDLLNIIAVAGESSSVVGSLLVQEEDDVRAWSLLSGDIVVVPPNAVHNLAPFPDGAPLRFFVLNNSASTYEVSDTSDYHDQYLVDLAKVAEVSRKVEGPALWHVRSL